MLTGPLPAGTGTGSPLHASFVVGAAAFDFKVAVTSTVSPTCLLWVSGSTSRQAVVGWLAFAVWIRGVGRTNWITVENKTAMPSTNAVGRRETETECRTP